MSAISGAILAAIVHFGSNGPVLETVVIQSKICSWYLLIFDIVQHYGLFIAAHGSQMQLGCLRPHTPFKCGKMALLTTSLLNQNDELWCLFQYLSQRVFHSWSWLAPSAAVLWFNCWGLQCHHIAIERVAMTVVMTVLRFWSPPLLLDHRFLGQNQI